MNQTFAQWLHLSSCQRQNQRQSRSSSTNCGLLRLIAFCMSLTLDSIISSHSREKHDVKHLTTQADATEQHIHPPHPNHQAHASTSTELHSSIRSPSDATSVPTPSDPSSSVTVLEILALLFPCLITLLPVIRLLSCIQFCASQRKPSLQSIWV